MDIGLWLQDYSNKKANECVLIDTFIKKNIKERFSVLILKFLLIYVYVLFFFAYIHCDIY
jgi:hypothetical protein